MARYRVTVDTGGTFSDFVYLNEETGALSIAKLPSTPDDPSRAILAGIEALLATADEPADIGYFCHGTTVGPTRCSKARASRPACWSRKDFAASTPWGSRHGRTARRSSTSCTTSPRHWCRGA